MDHLRAQQLISDALDKLQVDRFELVEAKDHCRTCPECAAFVRALIAVQKMPPSAPTDDLPERIMERVRAEAFGGSAPSALETTGPPAGSPAAANDTDEPVPARTFSDLWERVRHPRNRQRLIAWGSAAAVIFILAGWGAIVGVRSILVPPKLSEVTITARSSDESAMSPPTEDSGLQGESLSGNAPAGEQVTAPGMIEVSGTIYRLLGQSTRTDTDELREIGRTRTALQDAAARPDNHDVLGSERDLRAYIVTDSGVYEFEAVTRDYGGRRFVLRGERIERFGEWPGLPADIPEPSSPDGSPTFEPLESDGSSTSVYARKGRTAEEGIALPPNPPAPDIVAGCPNWTWWTPVP